MDVSTSSLVVAGDAAFSLPSATFRSGSSVSVGGLLSVAAGSTVYWTSSLSVSAGGASIAGVVTGSGAGFGQNQGPGTGSGHGQGALHAGCAPGNAFCNQNEYGDAFAPTQAGSGGRSGNDCGNVCGSGGGALSLSVSGNFSLSGSISADGTPGSNAGNWAWYCDCGSGGSGGSVWITAGRVASLTGLVSANGGDGRDCQEVDGQPASGGRVALYCVEDRASGWTAHLQASGGAADAGAGALAGADAGSLAALFLAASTLRWPRINM